MDGFSPPVAPRSDLAQAIEQLFRRYDSWFRPRLRRRYGDQADDLAQEAYLRAAAQQSTQEIRHHKAFLMLTADYLARERARKIQRDGERSARWVADRQPSIDQTPEDRLTLKEIVLALPQELRDVFVLNHVQGMTLREIAAHLGLPEGTVKDRARRALLRVSAAMRD